MDGDTSSGGHTETGMSGLHEALRRERAEGLERELATLQAVLDGIEDVIYVADPDSYVLLHVNEAFERNWGTGNIGRHCYEVIQGRDEPCPFCTNEKIFGDYLGESYVWEFQNEVNKHWYRCADKAVVWIDGRMVRFELAADITDRKLVEEQLAESRQELERSNKDLERSNKDLERSNKELEQFAYVASHDLSEPLRMVASYTQLLANRYEGRLDEDADKYIAYAVDGAQRMRLLIEDLLSFSRVGTRAKPLEPIDVGEVVADTLRALEVAINESDAVVEVADKLPTAMADRSQLSQVFQNLISNAIKFKGDSPPRVEVTVRREGDLWEFCVADNGIGVEPEHFERVFVIFQRLHQRGVYDGTGIGLAVVKKIVERHGGHVRMESVVGEGTRVLFTLPVAEDLKGGSHDR